MKSLGRKEFLRVSIMALSSAVMSLHVGGWKEDQQYEIDEELMTKLLEANEVCGYFDLGAKKNKNVRISASVVWN